MYAHTDSFRALLLAVSALARYLPLSLLVSPSLSASHSPFVLASGGCLCFLQDFPLHNALKNKLWLWLVLAPLRPDKYATICYFPLLSIRSVYAIFAHNRISVIDFASPCRIASQRIDSRYGIAFGAKHASPIVITIRSPRPHSLSSTRTTRLNARICLLMCDRYGVRECHYVSVCVSACMCLCVSGFLCCCFITAFAQLCAAFVWIPRSGFCSLLCMRIEVCYVNA